MSGPVLVTETCDFGNHRLLVIWQGSSAVKSNENNSEMVAAAFALMGRVGKPNLQTAQGVVFVDPIPPFALASGNPGSERVCRADE